MILHVHVAVADLDGVVDFAVVPLDGTVVHFAADVIVEVGLVPLHLGQLIIVQASAGNLTPELVLTEKRIEKIRESLQLFVGRY